MATEPTTPKKIGRPKGAKDLQPRKRRADLANFGAEYVQPGDNTKYLSHTLEVANLPEIDHRDPDEVEERMYEYFKLCAKNDMKPSVAGFCLALGISTSTLSTWKLGQYRQDTHQALILRGYELLHALWQDYMQNGKINPVAGIFLGKNLFDYKDSQEHILAQNIQEIEQKDAAEIAAKYEELPTIDD